MSGAMLQEDAGIIKVWSVCLAMHSIWRQTEKHDLGIDGQIEFLEEDSDVKSTGKILAVQVKAGPSWFENKERDDHVVYYPEEKHRRYWLLLNLPVVLVLHDPTRDLTVYANVKPQLIQQSTPIRLAKSSCLTAQSRQDLIRIVDQGAVPPDPEKILESFRSVTLKLDSGDHVTGIEFLLACTNPDEFYFELRMCRIVALLTLANGGGGLSVGADVYDFILRCTMKCLAFGITPSFAQEFDEMWFDLHSVPDITTSYTGTGLMVVRHLAVNADKFIATHTMRHLKLDTAAKIGSAIMTAAQFQSDRLDNRGSLAIEARW